MAVLTIPELVAWGEYTDFYPQGPYSEAFAPSDLSNVVEIAAGAYHGLALKSDGNVAAWGNDGYSSGANHVPSGLTNAVQIAAGTYHNLVLKSDGTAFSWGNDDYGRVSLPPALSNFVAVAAGENHDLGLLADGTVVSWGDLSEVPPEVSNIVAIAAGTFHSLALREDGTVIAWGWDPSGETDVPAGLSNIVAIGAAGFHSLALRSDGTALSWGDTSSWPYVFQEDVTNLVAIAAGPFGDYGLRADGKPFPLESFNGNAPCVSFICPDGLNRVLDFAAGSDQVVYQVGKGQLLRTTDLHMGRLHWVSTGNVPWFTQTNVTHDGGDAFQSGAVSNGQESRLKTRVYGPGTISFWWKVSSSQERDTLRFDMSGVQLAGISGTVNWQQRAFAIPPGIRSVEWIFTKDNRITFGKGAGWVDRIRFTPRGSIPPMISRQPSDLSVWRGTMASFGVVAGGVESLRYQWQFNGVNLPGATKDVLTISNVQAGDAGLYRVRVSNAYGTVVSSNVSLTMLDGPPQILVQPTDQISNPGRSAVFQVVTAGTAPQTFQWSLGHDEIPGATNALLSLERLTYSQAGPYSVRIRNQNGTLISSSAHLFIVSVLAWGNNDSGQTNFVIELTNAVAVAGGDSHSLALRADGTVTAWGDNTFGQTDVPATLSNVVAIAAGRAHSLALKSDGTLMAWGANNGQQLIVPPGLSNVVGIAAKSDHNIAVTRSGEVFTWGDNFLQLPVPADLNNVIAVATAIDHSVALKIDGTVLAWGYGDLGATNPPVDLSNVVAIASGGRHSLALRADGRVFAWGYWFYGQDNVPDSLTNAVAISAGDDHSLALHADGTVIGWGRNDFGEVTIPAGLTNVMAISAGNSHTLAVIGENSVPSGPGFEPIVLRAALVNNQVSLLFPTAIGKVYSVESKSSLGDSNWTALTMILGDGAVKMVTDGEATHAQRFYRLRAQ
jgi:alpha-tubulin suppressor-like RCC1 family protein